MCQATSGRLSVRRQGVDTAARPLRSEYVTGNYFVTLGVGALGGRVLAPDDDLPSAPPVVVLSHHIWQSAYGGDPSVVGATFVIEGHPFTAIGVAPPGFFLAKHFAAIRPICGFRCSRSHCSPAAARSCASRWRHGCA